MRDLNSIHQITFHTKPTNHYQQCCQCAKEIKKGSRIARIFAGEPYGKFTKWNYYHMKCFVKSLIITLKGSGISADEMQKIIDSMIIENI